MGKRTKIEMFDATVKKTFNEAYDEFIRYCKARNLRPATIKHYNDVVNYSFLHFLKDKFGTEEVLTKDIKSTTIENYVIFMKEKTNANDTTVNTNIRTTRTIFYYFMKLGYMDKFKIQLPKMNKQVIETYTDEELEILLEKPNLNKCNFIEYRNWVIVNFLIGTGCRLRTLINIKVEDLDFENDVIIYKHTKNRRGQIVPISLTLKNVLIEYLQFRQFENEEEWLFCNAYGGKVNVNTLSGNLRAYNRKRGVMKTGIHRFRHTFAKKWILNHGDVFKLQKILGHKDMEIVRNYVEMFTTDLKKDFNEFNPLESLNDNKKYIKMNR
ncbi:tyrosine-type recombinase/integrase [Clostridium cochlearium]|uniref:tyrosine-type recombinase/integrase n=1 Tax=Clostridium cochlearium TaxID=1494 RepID=UPI001EDED6DF|nr:tyrosine-type recombinase/integrase [Bacteroidales bacterium MSK.15.36]MCG4580635.1 tyrosine-type recombinase/integrase [Clostridium cochlearium]